MIGYAERVWLRPRARTEDESPGTMSASAFQSWLGQARSLRSEGWGVTVLLSEDEGHAVMLACWGSE